tara:strand:+ start:4383 stop:10940 length:6558 start_codon:yes stop_codon:yes gene_type:complete
MTQPNYIQDFLRRARQQIDRENPVFPSTNVPMAFPVPQVIKDRNIQYPRQYPTTPKDPTMYQQPPTQAVTRQVPLPPFSEIIGNIQAQDPSTGLMKFGSGVTEDSAETKRLKAQAQSFVGGNLDDLKVQLNLPVNYDKYKLDFDYDPNKFTPDSVTTAEVNEVTQKAYDVIMTTNERVQDLVGKVNNAKKLPMAQLSKGGFVVAGQNDLYNLQTTSEKDLELYANSIFYEENEKAGRPIDRLTMLGKALYDQENISDKEDVGRIAENIKYNQSTINAVLNPAISPVDWFDVNYWDMALWPVTEFAAAKVIAKTYGSAVKPAMGAVAKTNAYQALATQTSKVIDDIIPSAVKSSVAAVINKAKGSTPQELKFGGNQFKYWAGGPPAFLATEGAVKTQTDNPWLIYPAAVAAGIAAPAAATPAIGKAITAGGKKVYKTAGEKAFDQIFKTKKIDVDVGITSSVTEKQGYTPFFDKNKEITLKQINNELLNGTITEQRNAQKKAGEILKPTVTDLQEKVTELGLDTITKAQANIGMYGNYVEHSVELTIPTTLNRLDEVLFLAADRGKAYNQDSTLLILEGIDADSNLIKTAQKLFPNVLGETPFVNSPILKLEFPKPLTGQEFQEVQQALINNSPVTLNKITGEAGEAIISGLKLSADKKGVTIAFVDEFLPEGVLVNKAKDDFKQFGRQLIDDPATAGLSILGRLGARITPTSGVTRGIGRREYDSVSNRFLNTSSGKRFVDSLPAKRQKQLLDEYDIDYSWYEARPVFAATGDELENDPFVKFATAYAKAASDTPLPKDTNTIPSDNNPSIQWIKNASITTPPIKAGEPRGNTFSRNYTHLMQQLWDNTFLLRRIAGKYGDKQYGELEDMLSSNNGVSAAVQQRFDNIYKELNEVLPDVDVSDLDLLTRMELTLNLAFQWTRINPKTMKPQGNMKKLPIPIDEILGIEPQAVTMANVNSVIEEVRNELQKKYGPTAYKKLKQQVKIINNVYREERRRLYNEGFLTKEQFEGLQRNYPDYVPTKFVNQMAGEGNVSGDWGDMGAYNIVRQFSEFGDKNNTLPLLETLLVQLKTNEHRMRQNKLVKFTMTLLSSNEYKELFKRTRAFQIGKLGIGRGRAGLDEDIITVEKINRSTYNRLVKNKEAVAFYDKGKPQYYRVSKELYNELVGFREELAQVRERLPAWVNGPNTMFKLAHTSSLEFAVKNLFLDQTTATMMASKGTIPNSAKIAFRDAAAKLGKKDLMNDSLEQIYLASGASQKRYSGDFGDQAFLNTATENGYLKEVGGGAFGDFKLSKKHMEKSKKAGATFIDFDKNGNMISVDSPTMDNVKERLFSDLYDKYGIDKTTKKELLKTLSGAKLFSKALSKYMSVSEYTEQLTRRAVFVAELKKQNPYTYKRLEKAIKAVKLHLPDGDPAKMTVDHKKKLAAARKGLANVIHEFSQSAAAAKAATRSVQATIDFARGGQAIKKLNYWIPFLNAAAEGTKIPVRAMFTQRSGKTAAAAKAAILAGGVSGLTWYNSTFKEYWDVDPVDRHTSLILMLPSTEKKQPLEKDENGDFRMKPRYLKLLPRLREWAIIHGSMIKLTEELVRSDEVTEGQPWSDFFFNDVIPETSPIAITGRNFSALGAISGVIPPIFQTATELMMNKSFYFNKQIYDTTLPKDDRFGYSTGTNPTYRLLAEKLNIPDIGGREIGSADVLRHGIRTFTGNLGEEIVLSTSDWIIENYFLEYLLDPEVIEPYKMIIGMSDEVAQQKALSELDPIIRQKVLIELKRRKTKVPVFNKLTQTFYGEDNAYGAEREIFPSVQRDLGINIGKADELDEKMQIHVNKVQIDLYEISEQYEKNQITPVQWREERSKLFADFQTIQEGELLKLEGAVVFQTLTDEQQKEYWQRVNDAMASRGYTNKKEYIYQQYQSIKINSELQEINEDLAFEEFFAKRKSYLDSLTESELKDFKEMRDARLNKVEREWIKESEEIQVLWDWTSRSTIEKALETGKELEFSTKTLKSEKDLKEIKLSDVKKQLAINPKIRKSRREIFQDYLLYLNLESKWQQDYRNPLVEQAIKEQYEKLGYDYDDRQETDDLGRTVSVSHNAWIASIRTMINERNVYKTALKYNNPNIDKYYSKWFGYSPLSWSTAVRNLKNTSSGKDVERAAPSRDREMPVHDTTQEMLEQYYPNVIQQGLELGFK